MSSMESPRQLRGTCDSCIAAKVKCSQHRPQCQRCVRRGDACTYGIDRKATRNGVTSRKNKQRSVVDVQQFSPTQSHDESMMDSGLLAAGTTSPDGPSLQASPYHMDDPIYLETSLFPPLSLRQEHLQQASSQQQFGGSARQRVEAQQMPPQWPPTPTPSGSDLHDATSKDCYAAAVAILVSMQFGKQNTRAELLARVANGNISDEYAANQQPVSFHHVLATCSAASVRLVELMECPCAAQTFMVLLYGSIVASMMYWLQKAVESRSSPSARLRQHLSATPSQNSQLSQLKIPHCTLPPVFADQPITVGGNSLDSEEQSVVRKTLVLGKLKQVNALIERLGEVVHDQNKASQDPTHSYTALLQGLQSDSQKLTNAVRRGLFPSHS